MGDCVDYRRERIYSMPRETRQRYHAVLSPQLDRVEQAINKNAVVCNEIAACAGSVPLDPVEAHPEVVYGTLRQLFREWSLEGKEERQCFDLLLQELLLLFPDFDSGCGGDRASRSCSTMPHGQASDLLVHVAAASPEASCPTVLVPGSGLGRLPFEIARRGFNTIACEHSQAMLLASNFVLNHARKKYTIYPFCHTFSAQRSSDSQLFAATVPDIDPLVDLNTLSFKTASGPFEATREPVDAIVTCFFLDATPDILRTIRIIKRLLKPGGVWLNYGPLLWHYEHIRGDVGGVGGFEISFEALFELLDLEGFDVQDRRTSHTTYCANPASMLSHVYECQFFRATVKDSGGHKE